MIESDLVQLERNGPVATVWLNRPTVVNALSEALKEAIETVFEGINADHSIRVVVVRGRGKGFCAGADKSGFTAIESATSQDVLDSLEAGERMLHSIINARPMVVSAVHGACVGGGVSIALASDLCVTEKNAVFFIPEVALGLPFVWGSTALLIASTGLKRANSLSLTCGRISGDDAVEYGIANSCVEADALDEHLQALVDQLVSKPAAGLLAQKELTRRYLMASIRSLGDQNQLGLECFRQAYPHV